MYIKQDRDQTKCGPINVLGIRVKAGTNKLDYRQLPATWQKLRLSS